MEQNIEKKAEAEIAGAPQNSCTQIRFSAGDWLMLPAALICALLYFASFSFGSLMEGGLPGLGASAFTAALWAAVLLYLGREARWSRWSAGLAAGVAALTLCCCVYGDIGVRWINFLLIAGGSALCFFSISGAAANALTDARVILETAGLTLRSLFSSWCKPFRALGALGGGSRRLWKQILIGALIALPLLAVVIFELSSADAVFASLFRKLGDWLLEIDAASLVWRIVRSAVMTLMLFSALYFLRHGERRQPKPREAKEAPPAAPFITVLSLLCAVYALFVSIQFAFLFGGGETAAMEGGYAEYARNGFFQLLRVSAINLTVALICAVRVRDSRGARILSTVLLGLTAIILFSAFWRMRLYILCYGMTLLRAETLWAMAFIALCLALAGMKLWKRDFKFWPFFAALGLWGWILFNCVNIDARIADYNVNAYLGGELEEVDIYYLSRLSPDVLPALERLRQAEGGDYTGAGESEFYLCCDLDTAIDNVKTRYYTAEHWQSWCLSYARIK